MITLRLGVLPMIQKTKIVTTIGPATEDITTLESLIRSGVSIMRLNLKHNNYEWHSNMVEKIRKVSKKLNTTIGIMADLQGPELRTGEFANGYETLSLKPKDEVIFGKTNPGNTLYIPFNRLENIIGLKKDHIIFVDDGKIELKVTEVKKDYVKTVVINGGILGNKKSISIPNTNINVPTLTDKDKKDVSFSVKMDVDFIAISFVRSKDDLINLKKLIKKDGGNQAVVSKIETLQAIENFSDILDESDAIMIGRGDLGVEVPIERVPKIQKKLIRDCRDNAKPVIVATQMLKSMVESPVPTRAEVADIANAVFDKTDALMLSEETTIGKYPIKTVNMMSKLARYNENIPFVDDITYEPKSYEDIIITSSVRLGVEKPKKEKQAKGYIVFTESGHSVRMLSRFRVQLPIYAFSAHKRVTNTLSMSWGVVPFNTRLYKNPVTNIKNALYILKVNNIVEKGDKLIVIFGNHVGIKEANNSLSVVVV